MTAKKFKTKMKRDREWEKIRRDYKALREEIMDHINYLVVLRGYNPEKEIHPAFNQHSVKCAVRFIMASIDRHCAVDW